MRMLSIATDEKGNLAMVLSEGGRVLFRDSTRAVPRADGAHYPAALRGLADALQLWKERGEERQ